MNSRDHYCVKSKLKVSSNNQIRRVKRKSNTREEINFKNVKKAFYKKLIRNLNNQTFFKNEKGAYPSLLYAALDNSDARLINFLIQKGIDPNIVVPHRLPFLKDISGKLKNSERVDIVKKLIQVGVNINEARSLRSNNLCEPLAYYIEKKDLSIAEILIKSGANLEPSCLDPDNCNGCNPLQCAVQNKLNYIVDLLLVRGVDVNKFCKRKFPAVFCAILNNDIELMKRLLDHGADANLIYSNFSPTCSYGTALHVAIRTHNQEAMQYLLNYELTDINAVNSKDIFSALHWAVLDDSFKCIDGLLNANPDVNLVSGKGNNYRIAVEMLKDNNDNLEVVKKLKKHIVKLYAVGFYLSDRNLEAISGIEYDSYYNICCQEVDLMKTITISPKSHLKFYDSLFINHHKLALCLDSMEDQENLYSQLHEKFPSYAGMIEFKLNQAYRWNKLRDELYTAVYILFNNHLPSTIMEQVFSYFSTADLVKLRACRRNYEDLKRK